MKSTAPDEATLRARKLDRSASVDLYNFIEILPRHSDTGCMFCHRNTTWAFFASANNYEDANLVLQQSYSGISRHDLRITFGVCNVHQRAGVKVFLMAKALGEYCDPMLAEAKAWVKQEAAAKELSKRAKRRFKRNKK